MSLDALSECVCMALIWEFESGTWATFNCYGFGYACFKLLKHNYSLFLIPTLQMLKWLRSPWIQTTKNNKSKKIITYSLGLQNKSMKSKKEDMHLNPNDLRECEVGNIYQICGILSNTAVVSMAEAHKTGSTRPARVTFPLSLLQKTCLNIPGVTVLTHIWINNHLHSQSHLWEIQLPKQHMFGLWKLVHFKILFNMNHFYFYHLCPPFWHECN